MSLCFSGINFANVSVGLWNCSNSVVFFVFHLKNKKSLKISKEKLEPVNQRTDNAMV